MSGPKELFGGDTLKIEYFDSQTKGAIGYHIYQVDYSTTSKVELECYVNGKKTDYHLTRTNDQLLFVDLVPWRNDAVNLYDLRIPYLGDNSGVIRLIKETGVAMGEDFTIELKTDKKPYGLKVIYTEYTMDFDNTIFSPYATELLGLINNLDYIYTRVLLQKIFTVSRNCHDCYNCTIIAPRRMQKWLKAYLNGNTSNPILFCSVSDGI